MLDNEPSEPGGAQPQPVSADTDSNTTTDTEATTTPIRRTRRRPTKTIAEAADGGTAPAATAADTAPAGESAPESATQEAAPRTRRRRATKATPPEDAALELSSPATADPATSEPAPEPAPRTRRRGRASAGPAGAEAEAESTTQLVTDAPSSDQPPRRRGAAIASVLFMPPVEPDESPPSGREPGTREPGTREPGTREPRTRASRTTRGSRAGQAQTQPEADAFAEVEPTEGVEPALDAETPVRSRRRRGRRTAEPEAVATEDAVDELTDEAEIDEEDDDDDESAAARRRRRRGRRGRGRGRGGADDDDAFESSADDTESDSDSADSDDAEGGDDSEAGGEDESDEPLTRRRRRRRRKGAADAEPTTDEPHVVVKIREPRQTRERERERDEVQGVSGSTRLEAKRQRRRDGREQRRTRPPILSEAEFLARREAVDRVMAIRQKGDRTQIAVLEDGILVEHYVTRASTATMVGSVFLGRVQNVLPSMEAAFVDVGRGRNAVLYAGEVNWDASGLEGRTRTIEQALKSGDSVLVQVTKDPIGTKGARLTSHIALSGRHLVYVPHGNASGISRKLSDVERKRLRDVLKNLVPDSAGVIVRTAAEGASEDELARDVTRLQAQWDSIQSKANTVNAPALLFEEPDLVIRVVRDLFNEDFRELVIQGNDAHDMVEPYLSHVSPDLVERVRRYTGTGDVFADMRIDEQLMKALDRKVFLPSGGSLVIDRTEAMTVIDVNTGKYTGAGGNLEETVTRNNLEAAEEIVRQLRLRDLGGIIVIDFIDMVLESNRELVLRRLTECLGRDRTKHQVTEITSLGLVQMTRKRVGQGLLEAFSETCEVCRGRGLIIHAEPVGDRRSAGVAKVAAASAAASAEAEENGSRSSRRRGRRAASAPVEAAADEAAVDVDFEVVHPTAVTADVDDPDSASFIEIASEDENESDYIDADLDAEPVDTGGELRRRTRRGGTRRRTRP